MTWPMKKPPEGGYTVLGGRGGIDRGTGCPNLVLDCRF